MSVNNTGRDLAAGRRYAVGANFYSARMIPIGTAISILGTFGGIIRVWICQGRPLNKFTVFLELDTPLNPGTHFIEDWGVGVITIKRTQEVGPETRNNEGTNT